MIDSSDIFGALLVVAILLLVLSIPSMTLTVNASSKLLKRYLAFRSANPSDITDIEIPPRVLEEWSTVSSPLGYVTMLMEEIERLGSVRPAILQAEIGMLLIIILAFIPGYSIDVLVCMIVVLAVSALSILYWYRNFNNYGREYYGTMTQLETEDSDAESIIYR